MPTSPTTSRRLAARLGSALDTAEIRPASGAGDEQVRSLAFRGYRYSYRRLRGHAPTGRVFVLLGGALQDKYAWSAVEPHLLLHGDVITVDPPGWGDTDTVPSRYGVEFLADAIAHTLDDAEVSQANVIGACYGGVIALLFAYRHPRRVDGLLLGSMQDELSPTARAAFHTVIDAVSRNDLDAFVDTVLDLYAPLVPETANRRRKAIGRLLRRRMEGIGRRELDNYIANTRRLLDLDQTVSRVDCPVLVVNGEHDAFTTPAGGRELARRIHAPFATLKDAGHMMALEQPDAVTRVIVTACTDHLSLSSLPAFAHFEPAGT